MGERVTLKQVGRHAGLTAAAASLALRGDRSIPEATRERVIRAAAELHYVPNAAARALRARAHRTIGLLILYDTVEERLAHYSGAMLAVANEAIRQGYATLILHIPERTEGKPVDAGALLAQTPIDAAVCIGASAGEIRQRQVAAIAATGLPFAWVGRRVLGGSEVPHVAPDYAAGARMAVEHLAGLGHRRIALAMDPGDRGLPYIPDRVAGYLGAIECLGLDGGPELLVDWETPADPAAAPNVANARRLRDSRATAVFAVMYPTARRVLLDLQAAGVAVPGDVSVVGFSDYADAASLHPPLTVVRQPLQELGAAAARLVLARLAGEEPAWPVTLPPDMVVRHSCTAAAAN